MKFFITIGVALFATFAIACSGDQPANVAVNVNTANATQPPTSPLPAATIDELASGRKIYSVSCQNCHRENGKGGPTEIEGKKIDPDDLTSAKIKGFSDEKILGYIKNGVEDEGMPAFEGRLSEAEMRDVLKYVRVELQGMPIDSVVPKR
jgi:mono/diheme cytochrome c family protein